MFAGLPLTLSLFAGFLYERNEFLWLLEILVEFFFAIKFDDHRSRLPTVEATGNSNKIMIIT